MLLALQGINPVRGRNGIEGKGKGEKANGTAVIAEHRGSRFALTRKGADFSYGISWQRKEGKPMNDNNSMTVKTERLSDTKQLEQQWKTIDWKKAEQEVNRLQARIAKATQEKKWNSVKRLQYLLTHSYHAKALAVKKVTTNKGKNTAGVDG